MFWCPQLDATRKETGLFDFFSRYHSKGYEDKDIVTKYLWAMNDDPIVVKDHGSVLIKMRNKWYREAESKGINLNVRKKII